VFFIVVHWDLFLLQVALVKKNDQRPPERVVCRRKILQCCQIIPSLQGKTIGNIAFPQILSIFPQHIVDILLYSAPSYIKLHLFAGLAGNQLEFGEKIAISYVHWPKKSWFLSLISNMLVYLYDGVIKTVSTASWNFFRHSAYYLYAFAPEKPPLLVYLCFYLAIF